MTRKAYRNGSGTNRGDGAQESAMGPWSALAGYGGLRSTDGPVTLWPDLARWQLLHNQLVQRTILVNTGTSLGNSGRAMRQLRHGNV